MLDNVGVLLPQRGVLLDRLSTDDLLMLAETIDTTRGLDSIWVGDSLTAQPRADSLTLLGALAGRTRRVRLGVACMASFPVRDPAVFAYQWASLDRLSGGRMTLAVCTGLVGDGASAREGAHWGVPDRERAARMGENLRLCRRLWTGDELDFDGKFLQYNGIRIQPTPVQAPCPVFIAANPWQPKFAERALRRVADLADGWMTASSWPGLVAGLAPLLRTALIDAGRAPETFPVAFLHNVAVGPHRAECLDGAARFIAEHEEYEGTPAEMVEAWTAAGPPERCAADLQALVDTAAGLGPVTLVLRLTSWDQRTQLTRLIEDVLPLIRMPAAIRA
ncbi:MULTISPECIES: LLM class flavin-dependent oxidoreductase [unclassified Nocardia]|uniref:LLM class flavin-dependent oxidoreductase n=1 Tax=unclassified Nocardia TaxID=2637762 RepID=UPI001CE3C296|nr:MULTISPECIES: LLM class flavin-dependent oxidoreductase [unclassified Nocardia]